MGKRVLFQLFAVAAVVMPLVASTAQGAERRAIALTYAAPTSCPSQESFRARLAARLGYDPVGDPATHVAEVTVLGFPESLEAHFGLREMGGPKRAERSFAGSLADCDTLVSGVALALAIALDPRVLTRPQAEANPTVVFAPVVETAVPQRTAPPPKPPSTPVPVHFSLLAGVRGSAGLLPATGVGPSFEARLRLGAWSVAVDGDVSLAPTLEAGTGQVESSAVRGGLALCGHVAFASLCARGTGGALSAGGAGFDNSRRGWQPLATVGPLVGVSWRPVAGLLLQASLGLDVVLLRTAITLGPLELWNSPLIAGNAGLSVGWLFL